MPASSIVNTIAIAAWARSPVAPVDGALRSLQIHELAAPVLHSLLQQAQLPAQAVDAVVLGNALGAGGNPARMLALAAGLPQRCAAHTVDTQCCSGLDAVALAVGLIQSGQAEVVIAGGAEAWSRAPIRQTRPLDASQAPQTYERPAFAPDPAQDPDLLQAAADYALAQGWDRATQEAYAQASHDKALQYQQKHLHPLQRSQESLDTDSSFEEITPIAGLTHDSYPRLLRTERMARMPVVAAASVPTINAAANTNANTSTRAADIARHALSAPTISAKADGAALLLLVSAAACQRLGLKPRARWVSSASIGDTPQMPLTAAELAAQLALQRGSSRLQSDASLSQTDTTQSTITPPLIASQLAAIELHDAFAVQGLAFCQSLGLAPKAINRGGGGLARGHPIGASGAIALVRVLTELEQMQRTSAATPSASSTPLLGLAAIAGAGGIGAACLVQCPA